MRPPHYAGENVGGRRNIRGRRRFNEAPALRGGERAAAAAPSIVSPASMRPPHYAGENNQRHGPFSVLRELLQ